MKNNDEFPASKTPTSSVIQSIVPFGNEVSSSSSQQPIKIDTTNSNQSKATSEITMDNLLEELNITTTTSSTKNTQPITSVETTTTTTGNKAASKSSTSSSIDEELDSFLNSLDTNNSTKKDTN